MPKKSTSIYERPAEFLQNLIRFDTTNPPGNERAYIQYINSLLKEAGIKTTIVARTPGHPNVLARLIGAFKAWFIFQELAHHRRGDLGCGYSCPDCFRPDPALDIRVQQELSKNLRSISRRRM